MMTKSIITTKISLETYWQYMTSMEICNVRMSTTHGVTILNIIDLLQEMSVKLDKEKINHFLRI